MLPCEDIKKPQDVKVHPNIKAKTKQENIMKDRERGEEWLIKNKEWPKRNSSKQKWFNFIFKSEAILSTGEVSKSILNAVHAFDYPGIFN